jgi:glycosyltransferase involved in cell wall biosynthesis
VDSSTILGLRAETPMKISVITPVYNSEASIKRCLESVANQTWPDLEHIVVDGSSTDSTLEILNQANPSRMKWKSEKDGGIYDAMNRGLALATGEWVIFLGANDAFYSKDALSELVRSGRPIPDVDMILADAEYDCGKRFRSRFGFSLIFRNSIHHQACLYRRELFKHKQFDKNLLVYGDYDFNLYLYRHKARARYVPIRLSLCSSGGVSDTPRLKNYLEEIRVRHTYFSSLQSWPFDILSLGRYIIKRSWRALRSE